MPGTRSSGRGRTDGDIVKHALPARCGWTPAVAAALLSALALPAWAADGCPRDTRLADYPPMVSLRVDNDLFAGRDEGYTSGVGLTLVSPNLRDYVDDPCLPAPARLVNRYLEWLQPEGFEQQNMVVTLGQGIFTPGDGTRRDLIVEDRPYAGALLVGFGYNARQGNWLRTTQLLVGMVGPASLAEKTQRLIHKFTGSDNFEGWDHQLHNEPVLNLVHERLWRSEVRPLGGGSLQWDAITHAGGAVGNLNAHANTGLELRLGHRLPDDFGSSPVRPAGSNTAPTRSGPELSGWSWNAYIAMDARWVLRDMTLDGNTFRSSHSVDREPLVGEAAVGFAVSRGRTRFALARYFRTREFKGQDERPSYGSFTITHAF